MEPTGPHHQQRAETRSWGHQTGTPNTLATPKNSVHKSYEHYLWQRAALAESNLHRKRVPFIADNTDQTRTPVIQGADSLHKGARHNLGGPPHRISQEPASAAGDQTANAPACGCHPKLLAPNLFLSSCRWWAHKKGVPHRFFRLCAAGPHGQRSDHQGLAVVPHPQALSPGGEPTSRQVRLPFVFIIRGL